MYRKQIKNKLFQAVLQVGRTPVRWLVPVISNYPLVIEANSHRVFKISFLGWQILFAIRFPDTWRLAIGIAIQDVAPDDRIYQLFVRSYVQEEHHG